jgi:tRNA threonylcarbamoyladenosine modification (KEOPS) complex Cgi121 subunit
MDGAHLEFGRLVIKKTSSDLNLEALLKIIRSTNESKKIVQIFDPNSIINKIHILGAYANATVAFEDGTNKTNSLSMEMLLFSAMTFQIERAIDIAGAKSNSDFIIFSNDAKSFDKIRTHLNKQYDFSPDKSHIKKVSEKFGIDYSNKTLDESILQKIALSRLNSD